MENNQEYTIDDMDKLPYAKITLGGEYRKPYHKHGVWELDIDELFDNITPKSYFYTTGEACVKMKKLEMDLLNAAKKAKKLVDTLTKLKGDNVYLETQWENGKLILKTKNPRKNHKDKLEALKKNFMYGDQL